MRARPAIPASPDPHHADLQAQLRRAKMRYRSIFENAIEGIFQTTSEGQYIDANPALARIYGYDSPRELIASLTDIARNLYIDSSRRDDFVRLLSQDDTVTAFESQVRRRDGMVIWISENARAVRDSNGALLYYEGTVEDITARKEAEEALRRSQREIEEEARVSAALVQVGRAIISVLDAPSVVDRICKLTTEILGCDCSHILLLDPESGEFRLVAAHGYAPEHIEGMRVTSMPEVAAEDLMAHFRKEDVHFAPLRDPDCQITRLANAYGIRSVIHAALRRGDDIIGIHGAGYQQPGPQFTPFQMRIAGGIAQLTSMALQNARLVEKLESASRLKSDFVATMSHELRTPLNVILGYSELLIDGAFDPLTPMQTEVLSSLDDHACQLLELVNTTLDLGRLDAGEVPVVIGKVRLDALLDEIEGETRKLRQGRPLRFEWTVDPQVPVLQSDRAKLKVVLKNLISNAIKFTLEGEVIVTATTGAGGIEVEVRDTGIGIDEKALPIIFEAFRQGDSSPTRQFDGAGLGLYIVRRLLEVLGGTISVSSQVGKGSVFRIRLPEAIGSLPIEAASRPLKG